MKGTPPLTALYPYTQPEAPSTAQCCLQIIPDYVRSAELLIILETMHAY